MQPGSKSRIAVFTAVAITLLAAGPLQAKPAQSSNASPSGPWSDVKPGAMIKYRMSDPYAMPGVKSSVAEVTEEVTGVTGNAVTVKVTRREEGKPDQVTTQAYPRVRTRQQIEQFDTTVGPKKGSTTVTVSGKKLQCAQHLAQAPGRSAERALTSTVVVCPSVPGWIYSQSVQRGKDSTGTTWFQVLEFRR